MTNAEKYKTAEERVEAFDVYCRKICTDESGSCNAACAFKWLDIEAAEEKPLPCPFCGGECEVGKHLGTVYCVETDCKYSSGKENASAEENVAAHNLVARAVMDAAKKKEK